MHAQARRTDGICKHKIQQSFKLSQLLQFCAKSVLLPNTSTFKKQVAISSNKIGALPNSSSLFDVEPKSRLARIGSGNVCQLSACAVLCTNAASHMIMYTQQCPSHSVPHFSRHSTWRSFTSRTT